MRSLRLAIASTAALSALLIGPGASADDGQHGHGDGKGYVCSGGSLSPAFAPSVIPAGNYKSITVTGICVTPGGVINVENGVTIAPGAALVANFPGGPDGSPEGDAILNVGENISVGKDAVLILGCAPSFGCNVTTTDRIEGNIVADGAFGMLLHGDTIDGNVSIRGGGGQDYDCSPRGAVFGAFGSPVYSTLEDSSVGGNVLYSGYQSCWLGLTRTHVGGNVKVNDNALGDPDAIEILSNRIDGNISCRGNQFVDASVTPATFTMHPPWDSTESPNGDLYPRFWEPNTVRGKRLGQCKVAPPLTPGGSSPGAF